MAELQSRPGRVHYPLLVRSTTFLRRGDDAVQVGVDSADAFLLTGVDPALADVLRAIDGRLTLSHLRSLARRLGLPGQQLDAAIAMLRQAGLIEIRSVNHPLPEDSPVPAPQPSDPPLAGAQLRIVGTGVLGAGLARAVVRSGLAELVLSDEPGGNEKRPVRAAALAAELSRSSATTRVIPAEDWSEPQGRHTDLTVIATDTIEPDRVLAAALVRADQPHLVVRTAGEHAVVGPLVFPGRGACLRCIDLTRTGADPGWPELLAQLCRTRIPGSEVLTAWAIGTGLVQVLAALKYGARPPGPHLSSDVPRPPETHGATVELSASDLTPRRRRWASHPGCGCGWWQSAELGA